MRLRLNHERLSQLLKGSRLSQNHWALKLGLSRGHWSDIVNGRHPFPSAKTRERMLEVFGVAQEELFAAEDAAQDDLDVRLAIASRYEIAKEIGQGAMGTVSLATDRALGRLVAIKIVSREAASGIGAPALLKEIAFVARLQHPNILPLFEAGQHAGHPYYVMPYIRDGSLRALLDRRGRLALADATPLLAGIARALTHAHEHQVLHCDVKPENILVQDGHAFVTDFGIARKVHSEAQEWAGVRKELDFSAGTPAYVSPEQASGAAAIDARSDVYSFACVAYEMLSGRAPFGGRNTEEIVTRRFHGPPPPLADFAPDVPAHVAAAIGRAMSVDPGHRPPSIAQLMHEMTSPVTARHIDHAFWPRLPMRDLTLDIRYAFRSLRRAWRFALGVVLTLGLGVGLGVPVLSLADHFFLRPPPGVADPDRVVRLMLNGYSSNGRYIVDGLTGLDYAAFTTRATTLSGVTGWVNLAMSVGRGADAQRASVVAASASYFSVLGIRPFLGRFYLEQEDGEGVAEAPCVVSYRYWQNTMGGSRDAIGRTLLVGSTRYTVVGVAPEGFNGLGLPAVDMWLPLHVTSPDFQGHDPEVWTTDHSAWLRITARIKPGVSFAAAAAEAAYLYRTAGPRTRDKDLKGTMFWDPLQPGRSSMNNPSAKIALWLTGGGVLLVLLVLANLINLFIARAAADMRQIAVRLAIGGGWRDLLRLRLAESVVLASLAAIVGLAVAFPAVRAGRALLMPGVTWVRPAIDLRIGVFAFGIALFVGAMVATWTTVFAMRVDPASLMRSAGTTQMSGPRSGRGLRGVLLVAQAAIFAVLLTGAAAFVVSLRRAAAVDYGFDAHGLLAAAIRFPAETPRDRVREVYRRALERVVALPDVESASLGYMEPWANNTSLDFTVPGSSVKPPWTLFDIATPDYLRTFGAKLRGGRWFDANDRMGAPFVVVVNEAFERVFWPSGGAVGQCVKVGGDTMPCRTIVGVVRDFYVTGGVDQPKNPVYYLPVAQATMFVQTGRLFIRPRSNGAGAAASVRRALQVLEPNLPAVDVHRVDENIAWLVSPLKLGAAAFTAFGLLAAIVAALGLYSILSYLVIEQRRMHAIKLALGAPARVVALPIIANALTTVGIGMAIGYAALIPLSKRFGALLFHANALEPATVAVVVLLGATVAVAAALVPTRSVLNTDTMSVLREQ